MATNDNIIQLHAELLKRNQVQLGVYQALLSTQANVFGLKYRHFKGDYYWVLGSAINTVTGKQDVVYIGLTGIIYTRPAAEFFGSIDDDPKHLRFVPVED